MSGEVKLEGHGIWSEGATVVPTHVLRRKDISPGAKCAYGTLLSYAWNSGGCFPGMQTLATAIGCSPNTARGYINELCDVKLVLRERRGQGRTNVYTLPGTQIGKPKVRLPGKKSRNAEFAFQETQKTTVLEAQKTAQEVFSVEVFSEEEGASAPDSLTAGQYKKRIAVALASGIARHNGFTGAIESDFHIRPNWDTKTARAFIEHMAVNYQARAEDVHRFAQWWRQSDWRGQKGQSPTLAQIRENWPQAFVSQDEFIPEEVYE